MSDIANWILNNLGELFNAAVEYNPLRVVFHDSEFALTIAHASILSVICCLTGFAYWRAANRYPINKHRRSATKNAFLTSLIYLGGVIVAFAGTGYDYNKPTASYFIVGYAVVGLLFSSYYSPFINGGQALKSQSVAEIISQALQAALMFTCVTQILENVHPSSPFGSYNEGLWLTDLVLIVAMVIAWGNAAWQIRKRNRTTRHQVHDLRSLIKESDDRLLAAVEKRMKKLKDRRLKAYGTFNLPS